jgi:hypothetical protein
VIKAKEYSIDCPADSLAGDGYVELGNLYAARAKNVNIVVIPKLIFNTGFS